MTTAIRGAVTVDSNMEDSIKNATVELLIMVATLTYLKKGGRVTPAAAAIGSLLHIKPVLKIDGAKLDKFAQVMTLGQAKRKMIDQMIKDIETKYIDLVNAGKFKVFMAYTYDKEKCLEFKKEADLALKKFNLEIELCDPLSLSVSCHIGDGAIAIAGCETYK